MCLTQVISLCAHLRLSLKFYSFVVLYNKAVVQGFAAECSCAVSVGGATCQHFDSESQIPSAPNLLELESEFAAELRKKAV